MTRPLLTGILCALIALPASSAQAGDDVLAAAKAQAEAGSRAPQVARDAFMHQADLRDVSMSPDGVWLAFRRATDRGLTLWVRNIDTGNEHRIAANSESTTTYWSGDGARLWLVTPDGVGVYNLQAQSGRRILRFDPERRQAFFGVDANAPSYAILREKIARDGQWSYRYLTLDPDGKTQAIYASHQALSDILLDREGQPRYLAGYGGPDFDTVIWQVQDGHKRALMRCPLPEQCRPVAYAGDTVWALAHNGHDRMSLQRYSGKAGKWQILQQDPRGIADASALLMAPDGKHWFAIAFRPDRLEWHGRTRHGDAELARLQRKLPNANLYLSLSNDGRRWFVRAAKANWQYDRYFLYAVSDHKLTPLFASERRARVPASAMADMLPLHWTNPGGVELHGYAFLPKGVPLAKAPIIAFIHGGPYNRTDGTMDVGMQLMVNRGYVVFKPNFRASTGYGIKYATGSRGNFGKHGGALDDIVSGLDYLLDHGIGDPHKQAVVGHSFGGYASLLAVADYPDRFAFAVPSAAPVDFAWTMEDVAIEGGSALPIDGPPVNVLLTHFGIPYADSAWHKQMHAASPLAHAKDLHTPVYLWAGAKDDRVAVESLVRYVSATKPAHRPALLIDPDAGHSPHGHLHNDALAWLIEAAANESFGGGLTPPSKALQAFIDRNLHRSKAAPLP